MPARHYAQTAAITRVFRPSSSPPQNDLHISYEGRFAEIAVCVCVLVNNTSPSCTQLRSSYNAIRKMQMRDTTGDSEMRTCGEVTQPILLTQYCHPCDEHFALLIIHSPTVRESTNVEFKCWRLMRNTRVFV